MQRLARSWTLVRRKVTTVLKSPRRHVVSVLTMAIMTTSMVAFLNVVTMVDNVAAGPKSFVTRIAKLNAPYSTAMYRKKTPPSHHNVTSFTHLKYEDVDNRTTGSLLDIAKLSSSGKVISDARIVVILAYQRTGSTFVGKLIEQIPGAFYAFEPIGAIAEAFRAAKEVGPKLMHIDGSLRHYGQSDVKDTVDTEVFNWLTCRLDLQSVQTLTHSYYLHAKSMKQLNACMRPYIRVQHTPKGSKKPPDNYAVLTDKTQINKCTRLSMKSCNDAPIIALKFIRLTMRRIQKLLPLFPNMKILHLVRDPRGMYNSRLNLDPKRVCPDPFDQCVEQDCAQISQDLSLSRAIMKKYPDRLKILQYEDMAEKPVATAEGVYNFIGAKFTQSVIDFVKRSTSSVKDTCVFCTDRKNSSATSNKWRHELLNKKEFASVQYIQTKCEHSNRVLGYLPFDSESEMKDLRNSSRSHFNVTKQLFEDDYFQSNPQLP